MTESLYIAASCGTGLQPAGSHSTDNSVCSTLLACTEDSPACNSNTESTGSFHLKEQFNLTLTFPVRTEGNSVSNLLLKPNLENKRDKQNIFHLTYFVSLKCHRFFVLIKNPILFCPYINIISYPFRWKAHKFSSTIDKVMYRQ